MGKVQSLLASTALPKPAPALPDPATAETRAKLDALLGELASLQQVIAAAAVQATADRARLAAIAAQIETPDDSELQAIRDIADLIREDRATDLMSTERVLAALRIVAERLVPPPMPEPPTYRMRVAGRDGNNRANEVVLEPVKGKS